ncbi:MAG: 4Fe-4S dicluster domain-containing protein [Candidatus Helarchaeota archaeon]
MSGEYNAEIETFMGVPRKKIPWWPTIDYDKCNFCMECDKFCPHNVYERRENENKKLIIKNPYNCVVFCRACSKTCALDALSFPNKREITKLIKKLRKEGGTN